MSATSFPHGAKKGDIIWTSGVVKSSGCVLTVNIPPQKFELTIDCATRNHIGDRNTTSTAIWDGKPPKVRWGINFFETEKEAIENYQKDLEEVIKSLEEEVTRIQSYIKIYKERKENPPSKKVKKSKSTISI